MVWAEALLGGSVSWAKAVHRVAAAVRLLATVAVAGPERSARAALFAPHFPLLPFSVVKLLNSRVYLIKVAFPQWCRGLIEHLWWWQSYTNHGRPGQEGGSTMPAYPTLQFPSPPNTLFGGAALPSSCGWMEAVQGFPAKAWGCGSERQDALVGTVLLWPVSIAGKGSAGIPLLQQRLLAREILAPSHSQYLGWGAPLTLP